MDTSTLTLTNPLSSRFGWPRTSRQEKFKKLSEQSDLTTYRIFFQGKNQDIAILTVPLNLPKYRLANGRTISGQQEYLAKHSTITSDYFLKDPELLDVQETQHQLLLKLVKQSNLLDYFKDTGNKQVEPILLDEYGFVINGNRRLASWRELYNEDRKKYDHFAYIDIAVLPHCDEKEIDKLEAQLQIAPDIKAKYSWDTQANMIFQKQEQHNFNTKDVADLYGLKESEVKELLDMRAYAAEYLKTRGKENYWSEISENEFAFRKLIQSRSKRTSIGEQELFKEAAFVLIDDPEAVGERLYEAIPNTEKHLDLIKLKLQEEFNVELPKQHKDIDQIFCVSNSADSIDIPLSREISKPENGNRVREIITEIITSQKELKKDMLNAHYLLKKLAKANSELAAAVEHGLRPETHREGAEKQLKIMEDYISKIYKWLNGNA
ncbi:MAG: hypothetical protein LN573_01085 [Rickettsia endosymbiont of Oxypoda opaca]|nr:hypothetical protein [Rickettsia endosymbiont of Oxypoda opaca]